jgi:hypothetical protein
MQVISGRRVHLEAGGLSSDCVSNSAARGRAVFNEMQADVFTAASAFGACRYCYCCFVKNNLPIKTRFLPDEMGEIGRNAEMKKPLFCRGLRGIATLCSNHLREWMGIEPTWPLFRGHTGFEAQDGHQIRVHSPSEIY